MPPGERVWAYHEAPPPVPGQQTSCHGQERPIGDGEAGSPSSLTQDLQLVAEHGRLEIPLIDAAPDEQTELSNGRPDPLFIDPRECGRPVAPSDFRQAWGSVRSARSRAAANRRRAARNWL